MATDKDLEKIKDELLEETQEYMYQQSSKFSSVSRNLILGIIGTIWILTYVDNKLQIPNIFLLICLLGSLFYLLVDVIHYFFDSRSYQKELYRLDNYTSLDDIKKKHEPQMDYINKRSHRFIVAKYLILIIVSIFFAIGIYLKIELL